MNEQAHLWNDLHTAVEQLTATEKLRLIEEVARSLLESSAEAEPVDRRVNLDRLRRELAGLPVCNPADGLTNRDHDRVLYGERR
jgi:hypothetical protein